MTASDTTALLPCPFCGAGAVLLGGPQAQETYSVWSRGSGRRHHLDGTMDEAATIAAWNRRAEADALREEVAALRKFAAKMHDAWSNALELGIIHENHRTAAGILRDEARAAQAPDAERGGVMDQLPATPLSDDLVDRIAKEVAALVADHLETMYPASIEAVAWPSCKRSIQGTVRNAIAAAGRAAEQGQADQWIKESAAARARYKRMWRRAKEGR